MLTHGHFDHTGAVDDLRCSLGMPALAHRLSPAYLMNPEMNLSAFCGCPAVVPGVLPLHDGDEIRLESRGDFSLHVRHVPGHTEDSILLYAKAGQLAFVGDTIFMGGIGTAQYPGGDPAALKNSLLKTVFSLPEETLLLPQIRWRQRAS